MSSCCCRLYVFTFIITRTYCIQMNSALKFDAPKNAAFAGFIQSCILYIMNAYKHAFIKVFFVRCIPTCIRKHLRNIIFAFASCHLPKIAMCVSRKIVLTACTLLTERFELLHIVVNKKKSCSMFLLPSIAISCISLTS